MHQLRLDIKDSIRDNRYLLIHDLSEWDPMLEIKNRILQILPPYGDCYVEVPFPRDSMITVSGIHLKLSKTLMDLPDGLYQIHYSVSPNQHLNVVYNHFRVAELMNQVLAKMAAIDYNDAHSIDMCGNVNLTKMQNTLLHIWMQLKGAQAVGRETSTHEKAKELYRQAYSEYQRLFDKCYV